MLSVNSSTFVSNPIAAGSTPKSFSLSTAESRPKDCSAIFLSVLIISMPENWRVFVFSWFSSSEALTLIAFFLIFSIVSSISVSVNSDMFLAFSIFSAAPHAAIEMD